MSRELGTAKTFSAIANNLVKQKLIRENKILQANKNRRKDNYYNQFERYQGKPLDYIREILDVTLWSKQIEVVEAMTKYKKVLVRSGHSTGKTHLLGCLINALYDSYPSVTGIATAATNLSLVDTLFATARNVRKTRNDFRGYAKPFLMAEDNPEKSFKGIVPSSPDALHGRHRKATFFLVDEAQESLTLPIHDALESMFIGDNTGWICTYNPLSTSSYVYQLEQKKDWHVVTISCLDHPNIKYELEHPNCSTNDLPIPGAVDLKMVMGYIENNSSPVDPRYKVATDILIPGTTDQWVRPNSTLSSRLLARFPSTAFNNVWSDDLATVTFESKIELDYSEPPVIGVDPSRFGDDRSCIAIRQGKNLLELHTYSGMRGDELAIPVKEHVMRLAQKNNTIPSNIEINIDINGWGSATADSIRVGADYGEWNINEINVSERAFDAENYAIIRDELWFALMEQANKGLISFSMVDEDVKIDLKNEFLLPLYSIDAKGRKVVESKKSIKRRTKHRSPDMADSVNLAFYNPSPSISVTVSEPE